MINNEKLIKDLRDEIRDLKSHIEYGAGLLLDSTRRARMAVNAAHTLRIFFDAALQQYGKGNADFTRFFSGTDYALQVTKIVEAYLRNDLEQSDYLDYLQSFQSTADFEANFADLLCHYDEFEQFLHDILGTGLLGGRVFPENYGVVEEDVLPEGLAEKVAKMDEDERQTEFDKYDSMASLKA